MLNHNHVWPRILLATCICTPCFGTAIGCAAADKVDKKAVKKEPGPDIKLERVPPMTPQQSLASIEVSPGFRMELVAAEPKLMSPGAAALDENNRLYVAEMPDYPKKTKGFLGRIRV